MKNGQYAPVLLLGYHFMEATGGEAGLLQVGTQVSDGTGPWRHPAPSTPQLSGPQEWGCCSAHGPLVWFFYSGSLTILITEKECLDLGDFPWYTIMPFLYQFLSIGPNCVMSTIPSKCTWRWFEIMMMNKGETNQGRDCRKKVTSPFRFVKITDFQLFSSLPAYLVLHMWLKWTKWIRFCYQVEPQCLDHF